MRSTSVNNVKGVAEPCSNSNRYCLMVRPLGISGQFAVGSDDSVARDDDADRVPIVGLSYCPAC